MNSKLFTYLKTEEDILAKMIENAEKQQSALVNFEHYKIEQLALEQNYYAKSLRNLEEMRIRLIMEETRQPRVHISGLKISNLAKFLDSDETKELKLIQKKLRIKLGKLNTLNSINKVLSQRALRTAQEMLSILTKDLPNKSFCNAKI